MNNNNNIYLLFKYCHFLNRFLKLVSLSLISFNPNKQTLLTTKNVLYILILDLMIIFNVFFLRITLLIILPFILLFYFKQIIFL